MKPGTRLKSAVCDTEVVVIRHGGGGTLECGGAPMAETKPATPAPLNPDLAGGTVMGKRYVDGAGQIEVLCAKAGKGSLSVNGAPLSLKEAKPLPASD
jgi:hypothetical protein